MKRVATDELPPYGMTELILFEAVCLRTRQGGTFANVSWPSWPSVGCQRSFQQTFATPNYCVHPRQEHATDKGMFVRLGTDKF